MAVLALPSSVFALVEVSVILSKTSSQTFIVLGVNQWIELSFYSVMTISLFALYVFSFGYLQKVVGYGYEIRQKVKA
jgi:hypothetical protein